MNIVWRETRRDLGRGVALSDVSALWETRITLFACSLEMFRRDKFMFPNVRIPLNLDIKDQKSLENDLF